MSKYEDGYFVGRVKEVIDAIGLGEKKIKMDLSTSWFGDVFNDTRDVDRLIEASGSNQIDTFSVSYIDNPGDRACMQRVIAGIKAKRLELNSFFSGNDIAELGGMLANMQVEELSFSPPVLRDYNMVTFAEFASAVGSSQLTGLDFELSKASEAPESNKRRAFKTLLEGVSKSNISRLGLPGWLLDHTDIVERLKETIPNSQLTEITCSDANEKQKQVLAELNALASENAVIVVVDEGEDQTLSETTPEPSIREANFSFLLNSSDGTHMERIERAMELANEVIADFESSYLKFVARIEEIESRDIPKAELGKRSLKEAKDVASGENARIDSRIVEHKRNIEAGNIAYDRTYNRDSLIGAAGHYLGTIFEEVPLLNFIDRVLHRNKAVQRYSKRAVESVKTEFFNELDAAKARLLEADKEDLTVYERQILDLDEAIEAFKSEIDLVLLQKDEIKQHAIAEAMVAKFILTFGSTMSGALDELCHANGTTIDQFLASFDDNQRLADAVHNLTLGFPDSNDLSIILAEVNSEEHCEQNALILKEFVNDIIKPNIATIYQHASKVDLIYQVNLGGIATPTGSSRSHSSEDYDQQLGVLFSDAFGVESQIHSLSSRGASDVKHLFDFYLHRHGDRYLSDAKIRDGIVGSDKVRKAVSTMTNDEVDHHVERTKSAVEYRQSPPDITDTFIRICGYEYFYPQAPNNAGEGNIMTDNAEAPAAYVMVNEVVNQFIERLSLGPIETYREKTGSQLDNLIAQTFIDFFRELGIDHAADAQLGLKRADLKRATKETSTHGFVFDSYSKRITGNAVQKYDLFLEIYARNLEKTLECAPPDVVKVLQEQIDAMGEHSKGQLKPNVIKPGTVEAKLRAYDEQHAFENISWRGGNSGVRV